MKRTIITLSAMTLLLANLPAAFAHDHEEHAKKAWEKCDSNKDGSISKDEFIKSKEEHFNKADKNGDGKLSKDEHEEMVKKFKNKWDD